MRPEYNDGLVDEPGRCSYGGTIPPHSNGGEKDRTVPRKKKYKPLLPMSGYTTPEEPLLEDTTRYAPDTAKTKKLVEKVQKMGERSGKLRLYTGANGVDYVRQMISNLIRPDFKAEPVMSMPITVELTQDHIDHGAAESCFWCPWALALEDATGQPWFIGNQRAVKCPTAAEYEEKIRVIIALPDEVRKDIHNIDGRKRMEVKPHSVTLTMVRERLLPDMTLKTA